MSNIEQSIARLEEFAIAFGNELESHAGLFPALKKELLGTLAVRIAELSAGDRVASQSEIVKQCAAVRVELGVIAERHFATVMAERQKLIGLDELHHTLSAFAAKAARDAVKQYADESAAVLPDIVKRELAAQPVSAQPATPSWADVFRGNYNAETTYARGDIFTFRGACLLTLQTSRGITPTAENQKAPDARFALIAAPGSPGINGINGINGSGAVVAAPATPTSTGVQGQFAFSGGYVYFCYNTNLWRRWAAVTW
jgi:hypothetical protein